MDSQTSIGNMQSTLNDDLIPVVIFGQADPNPPQNRQGSSTSKREGKTHNLNFKFKPSRKRLVGTNEITNLDVNSMIISSSFYAYAPMVDFVSLFSTCNFFRAAFASPLLCRFVAEYAVANEISKAKRQTKFPIGHLRLANPTPMLLPCGSVRGVVVTTCNGNTGPRGIQHHTQKVAFACPIAHQSNACH